MSYDQAPWKASKTHQTQWRMHVSIRANDLGSRHHGRVHGALHRRRPAIRTNFPRALGSNPPSAQTPADASPEPRQSGYTVTYPELTPQQQARAILEARIQILVNEAIATSAIEGIRLDPKEVRLAVIRRLAQQEGLL